MYTPEPSNDQQSDRLIPTTQAIMESAQEVPQEALNHTAQIALALTLTGRLACYEVTIDVPGYVGPLRVTAESGLEPDQVVEHARQVLRPLATEVTFSGLVDPALLVAENTEVGDLFTDITPDDIIAPVINRAD